MMNPSYRLISVSFFPWKGLSSMIHSNGKGTWMEVSRRGVFFWVQMWSAQCKAFLCLFSSGSTNPSFPFYFLSSAFFLQWKRLSWEGSGQDPHWGLSAALFLCRFFFIFVYLSSSSASRSLSHSDAVASSLLPFLSRPVPDSVRNIFTLFPSFLPLKIRTCGISPSCAIRYGEKTSPALGREAQFGATIIILMAKRTIPPYQSHPTSKSPTPFTQHPFHIPIT